MSGWALHCQKNETAKTTPIASAFKNYTCHGKKLASESHTGKISFSQFLTRFLYGEVASQSLKNTFWVQNFLFCAKVVLGHFGTTWGIWIEASPMALRALHCFGNARPPSASVSCSVLQLYGLLSMQAPV
jgi:hypothetical protein